MAPWFELLREHLEAIPRYPRIVLREDAIATATPRVRAPELVVDVDLVAAAAPAAPAEVVELAELLGTSPTTPVIDLTGPDPVIDLTDGGPARVADAVTELVVDLPLLTASRSARAATPSAGTATVLPFVSRSVRAQRRRARGRRLSA